MDNNLSQRLDFLESKIDSLYGPVVPGTLVQRNSIMNPNITEENSLI